MPRRHRTSGKYDEESIHGGKPVSAMTDADRERQQRILLMDDDDFLAAIDADEAAANGFPDPSTGVVANEGRLQLSLTLALRTITGLNALSKEWGTNRGRAMDKLVLEEMMRRRSKAAARTSKNAGGD